MVINDLFLWIVETLNQYPSEFIAFSMIIYCALSIFLLHLAFGQVGHIQAGSATRSKFSLKT